MSAAVVTWAPVVATAILLTIGIVRIVQQRRRGIKVLIVDRERTPRQMLTDGLLVLGLFGGLGAMVAACLIEPPPPWNRILFDSTVARVAGVLVLIGADALYAVALAHLGDSWRLGLDRDTPGPLATHGIYRYMRNPIYVALDGLAVGALLVQGRLVFLLAALSVTISMHVQMLREERFLADMFGDDYWAYEAEVGRYLTLRRRRPAP